MSVKSRCDPVRREHRQSSATTTHRGKDDWDQVKLRWRRQWTDISWSVYIPGWSLSTYLSAWNRRSTAYAISQSSETCQLQDDDSHWIVSDIFLVPWQLLDVTELGFSNRNVRSWSKIGERGGQVKEIQTSSVEDVWITADGWPVTTCQGVNAHRLSCWLHERVVVQTQQIYTKRSFTKCSSGQHSEVWHVNWNRNNEEDSNTWKTSVTWTQSILT